MRDYIRKNKYLFSAYATLALPIALQNAINYALNMMDTVMLGKLGETELSAVTLAGQPNFILFGLLFGLSSGSSILIAQYWGRKDLKSISSITGFILMLSAALSSIVVAGCLFIPEPIMSIFTDEAALITIGAVYLRYVALSYFMSAISTVLLTVIRCAENARTPLIINCFSLALNTLLNWVLIYGELGAPKMGVAGAGLATTISRAVELAAVLIYVFAIDKRLRLRVRDMLRVRMALVKDLFRYGLPALVNDIMWSVGVSFHSVIIGHLGTSVVAAYSVNSLLERFTFIVIGGAGSAASIIVGRELGADHMDEAKRYAKFFVRSAIALGVVFGILALLLSGPVLSLFNLEPATLDSAHLMIIVMSVVVVAKSINYTTGCGVLRSGGDSIFMMCLDLIALYGLSIPLGWLAAFVFNWPAWAVYACLMSDEIAKIAVYLCRYKGGKWVRNITRKA